MSARLLSIPEVAALLSCSRWHVYKLINTGEIPVVDIAAPGSTSTITRVREDDLERYVDNLSRSLSVKG